MQKYRSINNRRSAALAVAILFFATMALNGCKKETAEKISIDGAWLKLDNYTHQPSGNYIIFSESNKKVYSLNVYDYKIRQVKEGVLRLRDNVAEIDLGYLYLYSYRKSGDTLIMETVDPNSKLMLLKDNLGPKSAGDWAKEAAVSIAFHDTVALSSLAYHNNHLYGFADEQPKLLSYNLSTKSREAVVPLSGAYTSGEFDGVNLWGTPLAGSLMQKVDYINGAVLFTSGAAPFFTLQGLAFDGQKFIGDAGYSIYTYTPSTNVFSSSTSGPADVKDIAFYDGKAYGVAYGMIHRMNPSTLTADKSWRIPNFEVKGIAFDGTQFWVYGQEHSSAFAFSFGTVTLN